MSQGNEILKALGKCSLEYFRIAIELLLHTDQKEINYIRTPINTPNGGKYLVTIMHVDGPKVNMSDLRNGVECNLSTNGSKTNEYLSLDEVME